MATSRWSAGGAAHKESTCQYRRNKRWWFNPQIRRSRGVGNGNPLQYSCQENSMERGAWWATVYDVAKSQTRLSAYACTHTRWIGSTDFWISLGHVNSFMTQASSLPPWRSWFHFKCSNFKSWRWWSNSFSGSISTSAIDIGWISIRNNLGMCWHLFFCFVQRPHIYVTDKFIIHILFIF